MTRASRRLAICATAIMVAALGTWLWLRPTKTAELSYEGRSFQLPLPTWSTCSREREGSARCVGLGNPKFGHALGEFEYVEQLGSAHVLVSDEFQLSIVTSKRTRWFTEIHLQIEPR
jgi:hypothetical protein